MLILALRAQNICILHGYVYHYGLTLAIKLKHTLRQKSLELNIKDVYETTSNVNGHYKSSAVPLYYSLPTSQTHAYRLSAFNINKLLGFLYDTLTISRLCEEGIVRVEDFLGQVLKPLSPDP